MRYLVIILIAAVAILVFLSPAWQGNSNAIVTTARPAGISEFEGNGQHLFYSNYSVGNLNLSLGSSIIVPPTAYDGMLLVDLSSMAGKSMGGAFAAVDIATKTVIWKDKLPNQQMTEPIIANGLAIIGVGNNNMWMWKGNSTDGMLRVIRGNGTNYVAAVNPSNGNLVWRFNTTGADMPTPVYYNGTVIFATGGGNAYAVNARTGNEIWKRSLFIRPYTIINSTDLNLTNVTAPGFFDSMSSLTISKGVVFFGVTDPGEFYAINASTGNIVWERRFQGAFGGTGGTSAAIFPQKNIIVTGYSGPQSHIGTTGGGQNSMNMAGNTMEKIIAPVIVGMNMSNGNVLWSFNESAGIQPTAPPIEIPPITIYNGIALSDTPSGGRLYALNASSGAELWNFRTGTDASNPNVLGGYLFIDTANGTVYTLNIGGKLISRHNFGVSMGPGEPLIFDGSLLLYGTNGNIRTVPLSYLENGS